MFLGDLIDEASRTDDMKIYGDYVARFKSIYSKAFEGQDEGRLKLIFVSGDNDIGGEGKDKVLMEKIKRFEDNFPFRPHVRLNEAVEVVSVDRIGGQMKPKPKVPEKEAKIRFVVSHFPFPAKSPFGAENILKDLKADIVFSAHLHHGFMAEIESGNGNKNRLQQIRFRGDQDEKPFEIDLENSEVGLQEIVVPTCSYRMGEKRMAFGLATFNTQSRKVTYTNVWLPARFPLLILYLVALIVSSLLYFCCHSKMRKTKLYKKKLHI